MKEITFENYFQIVMENVLSILPENLQRYHKVLVNLKNEGIEIGFDENIYRHLNNINHAIATLPDEQKNEIYAAVSEYELLNPQKFDNVPNSVLLILESVLMALEEKELEVNSKKQIELA